MRRSPSAAAATEISRRPAARKFVAAIVAATAAVACGAPAVPAAQAALPAAALAPPATASAPLAVTAAKPRPPRAAVENCGRLEGRAKRACRAGNAANRAILKKLLDAHLVGIRGDGQEEDWTFCASGRYELRSTSSGSTGISRGSGWQVESARTRNGGAWFDAIVTSREGTSVAVAMRGGRWQVGIEFGDEPSQLGAATRSSARAACAAL